LISELEKKTKQLGEKMDGCKESLLIGREKTERFTEVLEHCEHDLKLLDLPYLMSWDLELLRKQLSINCVYGIAKLYGLKSHSRLSKSSTFDMTEVSIVRAMFESKAAMLDDTSRFLGTIDQLLTAQRRNVNALLFESMSSYCDYITRTCNVWRTDTDEISRKRKTLTKLRNSGLSHQEELAKEASLFITSLEKEIAELEFDSARDIQDLVAERAKRGTIGNTGQICILGRETQLDTEAVAEVISILDADEHHIGVSASLLCHESLASSFMSIYSGTRMLLSDRRSQKVIT
jgi:hypothetical protein